jgi:hypothetical protein
MKHTIPDNLIIERASMAPWVDDRGSSLVAARWLARESETTDSSGIVCYRAPDGKLIERIPINVQVAGPPCWFRDRSSRVLFPGGDGNLYRVAISDDETMAPEQPRMVPVVWKAPAPGRNVMIKDVTWPDDPRWGGRLLVSLAFSRLENGKPRYQGTQIWWIALNADATAIVAAERITLAHDLAASDPYDGPYEERYPTIANFPGGGLALAYLTTVTGCKRWQLRVAALSTDARTAVPHTTTGSDRALTDGAALSAPIFSPDGHELYALKHPLSENANLQHYRVPDDVLASVSANSARPAPAPLFSTALSAVIPAR